MCYNIQGYEKEPGGKGEGEMLEKMFKLSENKTDVKTEILAGITYVTGA